MSSSDSLRVNGAEDLLGPEKISMPQKRVTKHSVIDTLVLWVYHTWLIIKYYKNTTLSHIFPWSLANRKLTC